MQHEYVFAVHHIPGEGLSISQSINFLHSIKLQPKAVKFFCTKRGKPTESSRKAGGDNGQIKLQKELERESERNRGAARVSCWVKKPVIIN